MLKRAWIVLSVPWSLFWLLALVSVPNPAPEEVLLFSILAAFPWIVGPILLYAGRFIVHGTYPGMDWLSDLLDDWGALWLLWLAPFVFLAIVGLTSSDPAALGFLIIGAAPGLGRLLLRRLRRHRGDSPIQAEFVDD